MGRLCDRRLPELASSNDPGDWWMIAGIQIGKGGRGPAGAREFRDPWCSQSAHHFWAFHCPAPKDTTREKAVGTFQILGRELPRRKVDTLPEVWYSECRWGGV